eukprot:CAMPEP_0197041474 /NCGR_PEP_ID=MMETSP1384-20130603/18005_1 /TAXON_ID=29189 /ORGANISM="Ammonia sp." /LENGTH=462 /DNA_ID=CAMNT_0042472401 /DNA_START=42 /DNA_END=1430 /DNA_ORIENTATION=-
MANAQIVTCTAGEGESDTDQCHFHHDEPFNFNQWVTQNKLDDIKPILVSLDMTVPSKLNTISPEFGRLIRHPQLLQKSHFIPLLMDALNNVPPPHDQQEQPVLYKPKIVILSADEEQALNQLTQCNDNIALQLQKCHSSNTATMDMIKQCSDNIDAEFTAIHEKLEQRRMKLQAQLLDIEKEQKTKYQQKTQELQHKQSNVQKAINSCYEVRQSPRLHRNRTIIDLTQRTLQHESPSMLDLNLNIQLDINLDAKHELNACIDRLGVISSSSSSPSSLSRVFKYKTDGDRNGLIYYLGTEYAAAADWSYPKHVQIECTKLDNGNKPHQFIDRDSIKMFKTTNTKYPYVTVAFDAVKIRPNCYTLRHANPYGFYLRTWSLEGYNEEEQKWESIREHVDDHSFSSKRKVISFAVRNRHHDRFYSKFKIVMKNMNSGDHFGLVGPDWTFCCCGFEVYGEAIFVEKA